MLQPDVFFAYGLSSGLALAAGKQLRKEPSAWVNQYFTGTLLWLSLFYVPQIFYLLFRFPAWETMHWKQGLAEIPPGFMGLYTAGIIAAGVLGFQLTRHFIKRGNNAAALAQVAGAMLAAAFIVTVGWDGTGYRRLLYVGAAPWTPEAAVSLVEFIKSEVFTTLLWLEGLILTPYAIMFIWWAQKGKRL